MARKYQDDPAWRIPGRHEAGNTLLAVLVCVGAAVVGIALLFALGLLFFKLLFWARGLD